MSDNNDGFALFKNIFDQQEEERRIREEEAQIRYAERRKEKIEHRRRVESAAMKICDMVDAVSEKDKADIKPEEIVSLAAALNHATTALRTAEDYAESRPYNGGLAIGC